MTLNLISKTELQLINRKTLKYSPVAAEKDYFLTVVLKMIYASPLSSVLVFKGGTALHHCYLPQSRFSEDLDFTSLEKTLKPDDVVKILDQPPFMAIKKTYSSQATIKIERLMYSGVLDQPNSLKLDIDILQNVVLPAKLLPYKNVWGEAISVVVMDIREIYAEKLRAMSDRARYRDFYDFFLIAKTFDIPIDETVNLLKQKEIRRPVSIDSILANWKIASKDRRNEMDLVYYGNEVIDHEEWIAEFLKSLKFGSIPSTRNG